MNESELPKTQVHPIKNSHSALYIILAIIVVILVIVISILFWWRYIQPAFIIDGHRYSKTTYYKMIDSAKKSGLTQNEATSRYIEIEKKRIAAEKLSLSPTPNQTSNAQSNTYPDIDIKDLSIWQKEVAYANSLQPVLEFTTAGGYSGAYFRFPFTLHQESLPYQYVVGEKPRPDGWRNPKAIEEDKKYALDVAQKDHERIQRGASSEQIVKEIRADPRLARLGASNGSLVFTINQAAINNLGAGISQNLSFVIDQKFLQKENSPKLTDILTGKITLQDLPGRPEVDGYYYFIQIDSYKNPNPTIEKQFNDTVSGLKVEKNV